MRSQYKALKRVCDSGFIYQTWLPFADTSHVFRKQRRCLHKDGEFLIISADTGLPMGMTQAYFNEHMPILKKFGWFGGKLYL